MRAGAEVGEVTHFIKRYLRVLRQIVYKLDLVRLVFHKFERLGARERVSFELRVFFDDFFHLRLDLFENVGSERRVAVEIVVKAVFDSGTDGQLRVRVKALDRRREHVRRSVAERVRAALVLKREESDLVAVLYDCREVARFAVDLGGDNVARELDAGGFCRVKRGKSFADLIFFSVDLDVHSVYFLSLIIIVFIRDKKMHPEKSRCIARSHSKIYLLML